MSKLEELIKEYCPNGVEYKKLGELGKFYGGLSGKSKNDFTNGNEKFITYKNVYANPSLNLDVEDRVKINPGERQNTLQYGDIIFTGSSETPDECGFSSVITTQTSEKLYLNSFCFFFRLDNQSILLPDFAKHLFRAESIRYQIGKTASGVTRYNVSKDKMKQVQIPLPALPVQREIVRILDSFTLYSAELTAELTARRKQYEFYRDKLLNFTCNIIRTNIGQVCNVFTGGEPPVDHIKGDVPTGEYKYPIWGNGKDIYGYSKTFQIGQDAVVISSIGANTGAVYFRKANFTPIIRLKVLTPKNNDINIRYLFYYLSNKKIESKSSSVPNMNSNEIKQLSIEIPPIEVQERIVKVLDNFDAICSDLGIGLPAEIEKRQKQYEYYRDKLLSFDINVDKVINTTGGQPLIKLLQYVFGYAFVELETVLRIRNGKDYKHLSRGDIPVYGSGGIMAQVNTSIYDKPTVLIPRKGSIDKLYYTEKPFWNVDTIFYTEIDDNFAIAKYIYYCLQKEHLEDYNTAGGVPSLTQTVLNKIVIPLPTLDKQKEIVEILDKFDSICNDLSAGLPAEIEHRQKQYEYYRDKLLRF